MYKTKFTYYTVAIRFLFIFHASMQLQPHNIFDWQFIFCLIRKLNGLINTYSWTDLNNTVSFWIAVISFCHSLTANMFYWNLRLIKCQLHISITCYKSYITAATHYIHSRDSPAFSRFHAMQNVTSAGDEWIEFVLYRTNRQAI